MDDNVLTSINSFIYVQNVQYVNQNFMSTMKCRLNTFLGVNNGSELRQLNHNFQITNNVHFRVNNGLNTFFGVNNGSELRQLNHNFQITNNVHFQATVHSYQNPPQTRITSQ